MISLEGLWLLPRGVLDSMQSVAERITVTDAQLEQFSARRDARERALTGLGFEMSAADPPGTARIPVRGVLLKTPSLVSFLFEGGSASTYPEIISALNAAESSDDVRSIILDIDSPGGGIAGLFDAMSAIRSVSKPVTAFVRDQATSAAFGLAAQADRIVANNEGAMIGSVGIAARVPTDQGYVAVTSTEAPLKMPDASTPEGVAAIKSELDAVHAQFVDKIAEGRGITSDTVNASFGRGATVLAAAALDAGMIDEIVASPTVTRSAPTPSGVVASTEGETIVSEITLESLRITNPAVFAAAVEVGVQQERDRCLAFLKTGLEFGAVDKVVKFVAEGASMTGPLVQSEFMIAMQKKMRLDDADADDADADTGTPDVSAQGGERGDSAKSESEFLSMTRGILGLDDPKTDALDDQSGSSA